MERRTLCYGCFTNSLNTPHAAHVIELTALIAPIAVHSKVIKKEIPLLLVITLLFGFTIYDLALSQLEGSPLLLVFFALIGWGIYSVKSTKQDSLGAEIDLSVDLTSITLSKAVSLLFIGLLVMGLSSNLLVWGATKIAVLIGISDLVIGLTVVAFGTSLPELAASLVTARKGQHDIAIGNVVGSNMFNLLAVTGIAAFISPIDYLSSDVLFRD